MTTDLWYQLPPDMNAWNNAVIDNISQKLPSITNYIAGIEWNKLDPATGSGDGVIQLLNGMCAAPITIRGNKLAPIDVLATNYGSEPKFYPLSDTFLQKIYADNSIGEPVEKGASDEDDYLGPSVKIKHIKTVDNVKYASPEAANAMLETIIKSASVANWMAENMPDMIVALSNRAADINEKLAASNIDDLPDLMVVWKENDKFYANGHETNADVISEFCKMANVSNAEKSALLQGTPIVRDNREKVATIHIPTEQEVVSMGLEEEVFGDDTHRMSPPAIAVTTAYLKDGTSRRGIVISSNRLHIEPKKNSIEDINPQEHIPDVVPTDFDSIYEPELFICSDGYGISPNIKTDARIELSADTLRKTSAGTDPCIGMIGAYIAEGPIVYFGRIEDVMTNGEKKFYRIYDLVNHQLTTIRYDNGIFYEVTDERLPVASKSERTKYISITGVNGVLKRNNEGLLVIDGESHSIINCPFALMNKYAAAYEDAEKICKIASKYGKCEFSVEMPLDKTAAAVGSSEQSKPKNNKGTKTKSDDEPVGDGNAESAGMQLAQTTPEAAMSVDLQNDPEYGFGLGSQTAPGAGQMNQNAFNSGVVEPVSSRDLENVVQLNSPKVMDAYVMAGLAQGGLSSQENLLRTSDVIITALEHLSKLLFLSRQGGLEFVNEADIQSAMQKLTDVADSIGVQTSRIAQ